MPYLSTNAVLAAVASKLQTLTLINPVALAGQLAFQTVHVYAHENLKRALKDLLVFDDRVAFIVPTGNKHENTMHGRVMVSMRTVEFVVLMTDRVYGDFDAESTVGSASTVGTVELADLVTNALVKSGVGIANVRIMPGTGEPLRLEDEKAKKARECWAAPFEIYAGYERVDLVRPGTART